MLQGIHGCHSLHWKIRRNYSAMVRQTRYYLRVDRFLGVVSLTVETLLLHGVALV